MTCLSQNGNDTLIWNSQKETLILKPTLRAGPLPTGCKLGSRVNTKPSSMRKPGTVVYSLLTVVARAPLARFYVKGRVQLQKLVQDLFSFKLEKSQKVVGVHIKYWNGLESFFFGQPGTRYSVYEIRIYIIRTRRRARRARHPGSLSSTSRQFFTISYDAMSPANIIYQPNAEVKTVVDIICEHNYKEGVPLHMERFLQKVALKAHTASAQCTTARTVRTGWSPPTLLLILITTPQKSHLRKVTAKPSLSNVEPGCSNLQETLSTKSEIRFILDFWVADSKVRSKQSVHDVSAFFNTLGYSRGHLELAVGIIHIQGTSVFGRTKSESHGVFEQPSAGGAFRALKSVSSSVAGQPAPQAAFRESAPGSSTIPSSPDSDIVEPSASLSKRPQLVTCKRPHHDTDDEKPGFGFGLKVSTSSSSPTATITSSARTTLFIAFRRTSLPFAAVGGTTIEEEQEERSIYKEETNRRQEGDGSSAKIARAHSHPESHWHRSPLAHCDPRFGPAPYANHSHLRQLLRPASPHLGWGDSELMVADLQKAGMALVDAVKQTKIWLLRSSEGDFASASGEQVSVAKNGAQDSQRERVRRGQGVREVAREGTERENIVNGSARHSLTESCRSWRPSNYIRDRDEQEHQWIREKYATIVEGALRLNTSPYKGFDPDAITRHSYCARKSICHTPVTVRGPKKH
ncbi:MAG: hypothetical protein NXY57DRAFT_1117915 [Lentinula lateritia]|nr:MAG: hypothetical protein NXY57DRAFT_1117915 [Lentinula lateritia]